MAEEPPRLRVIVTQTAVPLCAWLLAIRIEGFARWTTPTRSAAFLSANGAVVLMHLSPWAKSIGRTGMTARLLALFVWLVTLSLGLGTLITGSCDAADMARRFQAYCKRSEQARQHLAKCQPQWDFAKECEALSIFQRSGAEALAAGVTFLTCFALTALVTESSLAAIGGVFRLCKNLSAVFVALVAVGEALHLGGLGVPPVWRDLIESVLTQNATGVMKDFMAGWNSR